MLDDSDGKGTRIADYFGNMFRLLREDLAYELKEEVERVVESEAGKAWWSYRRLYRAEWRLHWSP